MLDINQDALLVSKNKILEMNSDALIEFYKIDITNLKQVEALAAKLIKKGTNVDILINNAALNPQMKNDDAVTGKVEDYDLEQWKNELNVGLTGSFICSKVFGSQMAKKNSGVILNISSDIAVTAPDQRVYSPTESYSDIKSYKPVGYSVVKTGLIGLTKYLASYWGSKGVRVNALLPGGVYSGQEKYVYENIKKRIPLNRWAEINEYEDAIVFLTSDSSAFMTGESIIMDGGRSII